MKQEKGISELLLFLIISTCADLEVSLTSLYHKDDWCKPHGTYAFKEEVYAGSAGNCPPREVKVPLAV